MSNVLVNLRFMHKTLFGLIGALIISSAVARGQATLNFAGGSGTPLRLSIGLRPTTFSITSGVTSSSGPFFIFQNVGDFTGGAIISLSGEVTYSINGGASQILTSLQTGFVGGAENAVDLRI